MTATYTINAMDNPGAEQNGKVFVNSVGEYNPSASNIIDMIKAQLTTKRIAPAPSEAIPLKSITRQQLESQPDGALYRLGHSSILLKLDGEFVLIDPVFSERASPVQWAGPKRFHPTPIDLAELPPIKTVIISHDHYDHLDKATIRQLKDKVEYFVMPLRVGEHLRNWGVAAGKIIELDWWQQFQAGTLSLTATPTQHFSGRGLTDRNKTLWASFVIESSQHKLFFSGDSGYFDGFKTIGDRYGPFDIAMVETGAYNTLWSEIHMLPEQSLQAFLDLRGKVMLPIHNSTFDLSLHDWYEPLEQIHLLAEQNQVQLLTPMMGEAVAIEQPDTSYAWWRTMMPEYEHNPQLLAATQQATQE